MQKKHRSTVSYTQLLQPYIRDTRLADVSQYRCDLEENTHKFSYENYNKLRGSTGGLFSASINYRNVWTNKVAKRLNPKEPIRVIKGSPIVPINLNDTKGRLWQMLRYCHYLQSPLIGLALRTTFYDVREVLSTPYATTHTVWGPHQFDSADIYIGDFEIKADPEGGSEAYQVGRVTIHSFWALVNSLAEDWAALLGLTDDYDAAILSDARFNFDHLMATEGQTITKDLVVTKICRFLLSFS